jgi:hypothetical protein
MWGILVSYLGLRYSLELHCKTWYFWNMKHIHKPIGIVPMRLITKWNLFRHETYNHSIGLFGGLYESWDYTFQETLRSYLEFVMCLEHPHWHIAQYVLDEED